VTITVDIRPEVRAELARQAAARGRALEAHAASLLEQAAKVLPEENGDGGAARNGPGNLVVVCAMVSGLTDDVDFGRNVSTNRPVDLR
jgi:hypothetical protein